MSQSIDRTHLPCPCGKSSDAYTEFGNGTKHCFSCNKHWSAEPLDDKSCTFEYLPWRGISAATMRMYDVKTKVDPEGRPYSIAAPFDNGALQVRLLAEKKFHSIGEMSDAHIFGPQAFPAGGKVITIFEGWLDAMSGYEVLRTPCVSVRSSSSARKDAGAMFEYLNSFERIVLSLDSDEPGQKATAAIAGLFDFNKVYKVPLKYKDCNEYLQKGEGHDYHKAWSLAKRILPEGIISTKAEFRAIIAADKRELGTPYPFRTLNDRTHGFRPGELILLSADEGTGKTEILRAIEYHFLKESDRKLGAIHLEEYQARHLKGLAGYELNCAAHVDDTPVSEEEINAALDRLIGPQDERLHLYRHPGLDDPDIILDRVRFMGGACECSLVTVDPLSKLVSGVETDDERRKLDYIAHKLDQMCKDIGFTLILTAHVNAHGGIRGSTYPSKVANVWIHLSRDITNEAEEARNLTYLTIKKNRTYRGQTGPAGVLRFDPETFKVQEEVIGEPPA